MRRLSVKLSALRALLLVAAAAAIALPPTFAGAGNGETATTNESEETQITVGHTLTSFSHPDVNTSDDSTSSTAVDEKSAAATLLPTTAATVNSEIYSSEMATSTITLKLESTAISTTENTLDWSSQVESSVDNVLNHTTPSGIETSADSETPPTPEYFTSPIAGSSAAVEITLTTRLTESAASPDEATSMPHSTAVDDNSRTTVIAATDAAETSLADQRTDSWTGTQPADATLEERASSQTTAVLVSSELTSTSAYSQITAEEASTRTVTMNFSNAANNSQSDGEWTTDADSNQTEPLSTAQRITSPEPFISTSEISDSTTGFSQRHTIHGMATYDVDYQNLTAANLSGVFKESFTAALTEFLKIDPADVRSLEIHSGSTVVHFEVSMRSDVVEQAASDLKNKTAELHLAFVESLQKTSTALASLVNASGIPNITVHVMHGMSSTAATRPAPTTAKSTTSANPATSKSPTDSEIAGIAIGSVLGGLLLAAIISCICKKKTSHSKLDSFEREDFKIRSIANYEMVTGQRA